jgi:hypothetical protein
MECAAMNVQHHEIRRAGTIDVGPPGRTRRISAVTSLLRDEVAGADFGDERLDHRLVTIVEDLGAKPHLSIPSATERRAETEAAYRFFDNDKVSPERILAPHVDSTLERIRQCETVLLIQDTTELDLTRPSRQVRGAGPIDSEARRGILHHPLMAFTMEGVPLGTVWQKTWTRDTLETGLTKSEKAQKRQRTPIEQKESVRWLEGQRAARHTAAMCPGTQVICVSDSESDIYEAFCEPRIAESADDSDPSVRPLEVIIRAGQERCTVTGDWWHDVRRQKVQYSCTVKVSARTAKITVNTSARSQSRDARMANVSVRASTVTLQPPPRPDRKLPPVTVNLVLVEETDAPDGSEPICWLLVTTLPVSTMEDVQRVVAMYCLRWQIEVYFRTLKSGCRVEDRQFETLPRLKNCLAVYSIIAWRVMYLCYLGRECPDLSCEVVFTPSEWKSICHIYQRGQVPDQPPTLNQLIRIIASFGGYVLRSNTEPGTQTLWIGLHHLHCFALSWDAFGPDTPKKFST